jgi:hypothetical protein
MVLPCNYTEFTLTHAPPVLLVLPLAGWRDISWKICHDLLSVPPLLNGQEYGKAYAKTKDMA